ncbi:MAG TPA: LytTR family DNA-binding domain-containing protein [Puia sp.]|uniref:LytR/AlgR family response regulator transcription factor n=1 Tax=Puia sp. TaxID=2045100 RepID=UPI002C1A009E|nr:LytTR family DNA-binding domain-containing protein [Puia sp.]HVU95520.1 LytTR family DNA-binding domain-containing protein [Puia sp.]
MLRVVIVDDEQHCCDNLQWLLNEYCPGVEVVGVSNGAEEGLLQIRQLQPQLVFLDVEMPVTDGFAMLERLSGIDFDLIFTTAYDQYAIRAIRFGALDYLLKPVDKDELQAAVAKSLHRPSPNALDRQLAALLTHVRQNNAGIQKIALPTLHGYELVPVDDILLCESNSNYTDIRLTDGRHFLISRTLKEVEELLDGAPFLRVHNSFLVNLDYAIRYMKGEGGSLVLKNEVTVPVSRSKKEELLKRITHLPA